MWKVLIADDEAFVREGLKNLIPWEELGYQWSGDYRNGRNWWKLFRFRNRIW